MNIKTKNLVIIIVVSMLLIFLLPMLFLKSINQVAYDVKVSDEKLDDLPSYMEDVAPSLTELYGVDLYNGFKVSDMQVIFLDPQVQKAYIWNNKLMGNEYYIVEYDTITDEFKAANHFITSINGYNSIVINASNKDNILNRIIYYGYRSYDKSFTIVPTVDNYYTDINENIDERYLRNEMIQKSILYVETKKESYLQEYNDLYNQWIDLVGDTTVNNISKFDYYEGLPQYVVLSAYSYLENTSIESLFVNNYKNKILSKKEEYKAIGALQVYILNSMDKTNINLKENANLNDIILDNIAIRTTEIDEELYDKYMKYYEQLTNRPKHLDIKINEKDKYNFIGFHQDFYGVYEENTVRIDNGVYLLLDVLVIGVYEEQSYDEVILLVESGVLKYYVLN